MYIDCMTTTKKPSIPEIDNKRRDNVEVKEAIAAVIGHKGEALKEALALIKRAQDLLYFRHADIDDTIYTNAKSAVWKAVREVEHAIDFNFDNDCYLGNKACGPLGAAVLKDIESGVITPS